MIGAGPCQREALEALVRGELSEETAAMVRAHVETCPGCHKELMWLRVEQDLAARRQKGERTGVLALWPAIEQRLAAERRRFWRLRPASWVGQAAAAAAVLVGIFVAQRAFFHHGRGVGPGLIATFGGGSDHQDKDDVREMAWPIAASAAGPVRLVLSTMSADVDVAAGGTGEIRLTVSSSGVRELKLNPLGERRYGLLFDGKDSLAEGHVHLQLPPGSEVELRSRSGDLSVAGLRGAAQVRTASGEVRLADVQGADVSTVSGEIEIAGARGALRLQTVSGAAEIGYAAGAPPDVRFNSTSGDLRFAGVCEKGCALHADSVSGDMELGLDAQSSFSLRRRSVSGELSDRLGLQASADGLRYGAGAGLIELTTTSGDLTLEKR